MRYPYDGILTMPPKAPQPSPIAYSPYGSYRTYYHVGACWEEYVRRYTDRWPQAYPLPETLYYQPRQGMICAICGGTIP